MKANTLGWVAGERHSEPREASLGAAIKDNEEWFATKREAWLAIAAREQKDAERREFEASCARERQAKAEKAASECAP